MHARSKTQAQKQASLLHSDIRKLLLPQLLVLSALIVLSVTVELFKLHARSPIDQTRAPAAAPDPACGQIKLANVPFKSCIASTPTRTPPPPQYCAPTQSSGAKSAASAHGSYSGLIWNAGGLSEKPPPSPWQNSTPMAAPTYGLFGTSRVATRPSDTGLDDDDDLALLPQQNTSSSLVQDRAKGRLTPGRILTFITGFVTQI
ncbi:hypothetical protein B0H14DRAFT_3905106 [Mycena olivaceomarginata]|nr:hypothetical protein B0H14DRAFT_3905106 [Mycena olivaceomarginata]